MVDTTIKTVRVNAPTTAPITASTTDAPVVGGRRRVRRTRKLVGGDAAPVPMEKGLVQILKVTDTGATMNPSAPSEPWGTTLRVANPSASRQAGGSASEKTNVPPGPELSAKGAPVNAPVPSAAPGQTAGSVKVILKPKAQKRTKVLLKKRQGAEPVVVNKKKIGRPATTRKLVLKSLKHKMKRTRQAINHSKTLPIEQIKKILIEKKLIKPTSKAPESVLRQMYADTVIVSKKML
jgi:hypothetical protein